MLFVFAPASKLTEAAGPAEGVGVVAAPIAERFNTGEVTPIFSPMEPLQPPVTSMLVSGAGAPAAEPLGFTFLCRDFFGEGVSVALLFFPALLGSGGLPSHSCCLAVASFLARSCRDGGCRRSQLTLQTKKKTYASWCLDYTSAFRLPRLFVPLTLDKKRLSIQTNFSHSNFFA